MRFIEHDLSIVNKRFSFQRTGLMMAVYYDNVDIVKVILSTPNVDLGVTDNIGNTALHYSCSRKSVKSLQLLLQHPLCSPAVVGLKNKFGNTARMLAAKFKSENCDRLIEDFLAYYSTSTLQQMSNNHTRIGLIEEPCIYLDGLKPQTLDMSSSKVNSSSDIRNLSALSLEELQAELKYLIDNENLGGNDVKKFKEKEKYVAELYTEKLKDIKAQQEACFQQIKVNYEREKQELEKRYEAQKNEAERLFNDFLKKHEEEACALNEKLQMEWQVEQQNLTRSQERKQQLQAELRNRLTPLLSTPNVTPVSSNLIPECYVCFEECRPPLKLMTCGSGHILCEPCFVVMMRQNCGKCESSIRGRATDTEELIRKISGLEATHQR